MSRASGIAAERLAAQFLLRAGMRIIETNYTCKGGEIDLVCDDGGTVVFVEVKARTSSDFGSPEEFVTPQKRRRLVRAATHYVTVRKMADRPCRFDVIAVEGDEIRHLKDAFET